MAKTVLFVCTGNTGRSPMAEAIAGGMPGGGFTFASAGMAAFPGLPLAPEAARALRNLGLEPGGPHASRPLSKGLAEEAALIVTFTALHRDMILKKMPGLAGRVFTLRELAGEADPDIRDPQDGDQAVYDEVAVQIRQALEKAWPALAARLG